jgi:flavin reductase (DIM6/NTAB) family NADH-FMN oxidoreductase RutF
MMIQKIKVGPQQLLNPKPVVLVGTIVDDKPNFITVSWIGSTSANPPTLSIAIRTVRYSLKGIQQNMTFSVNIPSVNMVNETDYCGSVSGSNFNKIEECHFKLFKGILNGAPLIEQCPINMECEVLQITEIGDHSVITGIIKEAYITDDCITNGIPDIKRINPLCFCTLTTESMGYYRVGEFVAHTRSIKKETST